MATKTQTGRFRPPPPNIHSEPAAPQQGNFAQRIDGAHCVVENRLQAGAARPAQDADAGEAQDRDFVATLLPQHADDLVRQLQAWAGVLDRRESELNAGIARQENRERSFRLWAQSQQEQLSQLQREATRLREELKQQARRLAIAASSDGPKVQPFT